ncbi:hypothetical protein BJX64DRAFT_295372 [Aspergillus heterothallicus]
MSPTDACTLSAYTVHAMRVRVLHGRIQTALYSTVSPTITREIRKARAQELALELHALHLATLHLYRFEITSGHRNVVDEDTAAPDAAVITQRIDAAQRICASYRRHFIGKPTTCTWGALRELFLAGLTYLYCLWMFPSARAGYRHDEVCNTCFDCMMVLVTLAERWEGATPYHEALARRTMAMSAAGWRCRRDPEALPGLMAGVADYGHGYAPNALLDGFMGEFVYERERGCSE